MRRREFISLFGSAAAWPLAAKAQQANSPMIGYLSGRSLDSEEQYKAAFGQGLKETSYVEGNNVKIEYRFSNGQDDRLPAIAKALVRQQVDVLVATDTPSALAAKSATTTIPVVFSVGGDPIKLGLVDSLNRPGGNVTGVYVFVTELGPKRLQLMRELMPRATLVAYIVNLSSATGPAQVQAMQAAAEAMGQKILVLTAGTESEIDKAFALLVEHRADAIVYSSNVFFQVEREKLVTLAALHSIPAIYEWPEFVRSGGLISYSSTRSDPGRQMGSYAGQILNGAKPTDLPVVQSSKFCLNRPERNVTGIGITGPVLLGKQLGVLHQLVPSGTSIAFLVNPNNPNSVPSVKGAEEAAHVLGRRIRILNASTDAEIEKAFASLAGARADGLVIAPDAFFVAKRDELVALAAREAVPTIYPFREFTAAGGLMSYGSNLPDQFRQAGIYTGKILQGAKPAELPVLQPTKYELIINLAAMRKLGLQVPPALLAIADDLIE